MAASTKLVLVLVTLLLGVSILFYGVMFDGEDPLEVATPADAAAEPEAEARSAGGDAAATPDARARRDAGAVAGRPPLAARPVRPALGAGSRASGGADGAAAQPGTDRPPLGATGRRPSLGAADRTSPGQIEMGAARGPLAGGTRLPEAAAAGEIGDAEAGAAPLARPEAAGPAPAPARAERARPVGPATAGEASADRATPAAPRRDPAPTPRAASPETDRTPAPPEEILAGTWTVRAGDTMSGIARAWFGAERHWRLVAEANPEVDPRRLRVGQRLALPPKSRAARADRARGRTEAAAAERETPDPAVRPGERVHVVAAGDSLSGIAERYYGTAVAWRRIAARNADVLGGDPDRLAVGMKLRIPPRPSDD